MRALKVTLYSEDEFSLPLSHCNLIQGLLYSCWKENFPELHDEGYGQGGSRLRLFVFDPLDGPHSIDKTRREIVFENTASFEVRSLDENLLDELATQLAARRFLRLGRNMLELCNLESRDRLIFPERALVRMRSAVTTHMTVDDGRHTEFIGPDDTRFLGMCRKNLERKMAAMGVKQSSALEIIPIQISPKKVMRFKGTCITAWLGKLILQATPEEILLLYHTGLGDRNSQGFGMFDIEDKPLRPNAPSST